MLAVPSTVYSYSYNTSIINLDVIMRVLAPRGGEWCVRIVVGVYMITGTRYRDGTYTHR